jgi:beta-glucosidase
MNRDIKKLITEMTITEKISLLSGDGMWRTKPIGRLNIPDIVMTDGTHGVRYNAEQIKGGMAHVKAFCDVINASHIGIEQLTASDPATCFPNGCSIACSYDVALIEKMGEALGEECQALGVHVLLGPGLNIRRIPVAGRGYEYYSEDPVVTGKLGAAIVKGIQKKGVAATVKHLAAYNAEFQRMTHDSVVSERALREIYLYGFEYAIKNSNPKMVMSSYNLLNGEQTSNSKWLLKDVLRDDWGFKGVIVSDWMGIIDIVKALKAGSDLEMPEHPSNTKILLDAVKRDPSLEADIDSSCYRILELIFELKQNEKPGTLINFEEHHKLAREIAEESIVLTKNEDKILPIIPSKVSKIAVIGKGAIEPVIQGFGSATTAPGKLDIPLEKIKELAAKKVEVRYTIGAELISFELQREQIDEAIKTAKWADLVIVFVNRPTDSGEVDDAKDINLCLGHNELIKHLLKVNKNIVVVVATPEAVIMPWFDDVKGVINTFFSGQAMGGALARILFGEINPSGKMTVTFPNSLEETPAFLTYPGDEGKHYYSEDIYVGYRYYDKRKMQPKIPFGFGLSYTEFSYSNMVLSKSELLENETLDVTVDIKNTGNVFGKEIVQLYVSDIESRLARPLRELKGFNKVSLQPGEIKKISFQLERRDFCYFDPAYQKWIFETGYFDILIGKNERDICLSETVYAKAEKEYTPLATTLMPIRIFMEIPEATDALLEIIGDGVKLSGEELLNKLRHELGVLIDLNTRNALDLIFDITFTNEEYTAFINKIRDKQLNG